MASFVPSTERIPGVYQRVQLQRQSGLAALPNSVLLIGYRDVTVAGTGSVWRRVSNRSYVP